MKSLRKLCALVILTLALAVPTFSGDISCPGQIPPPPPPPQSQTCVSGDISCPGATEEKPLLPDPVDPDDLDPITEFTLMLFQTLMSLL